MSGFKRLPNNYGTICKLSGKRRKPYCAKKYIGKEIVDEKVVYKYKVIGTYATRREALSALADANLNGFDSSPDLTLKAVFDKFTASRTGLSEARYATYRAVSARLAPLHNRVFKELRVSDYESIFDGLSKSTAVAYRAVISQMYEYAMAHDWVQKNYAQLTPISNPTDKKVTRNLFTKEEVDKLNPGDLTEAMTLVGIYTGMRAQEIQRITLDNVDLGGWFFRGVGLKTEAGKNRIVPIHPAIRSVVAEYAAVASKKGVSGLFVDDPDKIPDGWFVSRFRAKFYGRHTSHDCRHTFATNAYACRMNSVMVKLILGHAVNDLTLGTYTHVLPEDLQAEMEKYRIT